MLSKRLRFIVIFVVITLTALSAVLTYISPFSYVDGPAAQVL
jgi:hypothetical protein